MLHRRNRSLREKPMGMVRQEMQMPDADKRVIERFAATKAVGSEDALRMAAINIFRRYVRHTPQAKWNLHMKFMSEVDSKCPDYGLRAIYRKQLIEQAPCATS